MIVGAVSHIPYTAFAATLTPVALAGLPEHGSHSAPRARERMTKAVNHCVDQWQAQRILGLLIRHANVIAFTLTQAPQYYEPLFLERKVKGRTVSIVDEWCYDLPAAALEQEDWTTAVLTAISIF